MDFYASAPKHGIAEDDAVHAIEHALVAAEDDEGKCLYLGPDRAGNVLEVVSVPRGRQRGGDPRDADAPHLRVVAPRRWRGR